MPLTSLLLLCAALPGPQLESAQESEALTRIPFTLPEGHPVPVVEARVNGKGPYRFMLDTGAAVNVFDSGFVEELGLPIVGEQMVGDPSASARIRSDVIEVGSITLGDVTFEAPDTIAIDRSGIRSGTGIRGTLGLPMFSEYLFTLDYPRMEVRVGRGALGEADGEQVLVYDASDWLPVIELRVDGLSFGSHIDSGSPSPLTLPTSVAEEVEFVSTPTVIGRGRTVNSEFTIQAARLSGSLWIGGQELDGTDVHINEVFPRAILGYGVLREFALTFDQEHQRVRFEHSSESKAPEWSVASAGSGPRLGVHGSPTAEGLEVAEVLPEGLAARAGVQKGDLILAVNGESMSELLQEGRLAGQIAASAELALRVRRGGSERELRVKVGG